MTDNNIDFADTEKRQENIPSKKGKVRRFWLGMAISVLFLYLALRQVDLLEVWQIMLRINPYYLLASLVVVFGTVMVRALRWKMVLRPIKDVNYWNVLVYLLIGYMMNNVLPLRVGEVGRSVLLARKENMSKSSALASTVIERGFDLTGLAVFLPLLFLVVKLPEGVAWEMIFLGVSGLLLLVGLYVLVLNRKLAMRFVHWVLHFIPQRFSKRLNILFDLFFDGLGAIRDGKSVAAVFILSLLGWLGVMYGASLRFNAFQMDLPFAAALLCVISTNFLAALPSSPGQVGVVHYAYVFALSIYGVDKELAVAYGVVSHAMSYLLTTIPGGILAAVRGIKGLDE